ncbi:MAG: VOC family protein [Gemmatimonadales bacterium]|jgi:catechol 2,3-dioxygenase-like lactoylglutathione lyase family enzyme
MIINGDAIATVGVKDMRIARDFYEKKLGLTGESRGEEVMTYKAGKSALFVYRTKEAGSNHATGVTWPVGNRVDEMVRELKAKGVGFEHYDLPDMKREGDVHVAGDMRAAWFKDPDGNIHALVSG